MLDLRASGGTGHPAAVRLGTQAQQQVQRRQMAWQPRPLQKTHEDPGRMSLKRQSSLHQDRQVRLSMPAAHVTMAPQACGAARCLLSIHAVQVHFSPNNGHLQVLQVLLDY